MGRASADKDAGKNRIVVQSVGLYELPPNSEARGRRFATARYRCEMRAYVRLAWNGDMLVVMYLHNGAIHFSQRGMTWRRCRSRLFRSATPRVRTVEDAWKTRLAIPCQKCEISFASQRLPGAIVLGVGGSAALYKPIHVSYPARAETIARLGPVKQSFLLSAPDLSHYISTSRVSSRGDPRLSRACFCNYWNWRRIGRIEYSASPRESWCETTTTTNSCN